MQRIHRVKAYTRAPLKKSEFFVRLIFGSLEKNAIYFLNSRKNSENQCVNPKDLRFFLLKSDQNFCPSDLNTEKCDQKANKKSRKFFFSSSTFSSQYFLSVETILSAIKLKLKIEKDSPQKKKSTCDFATT